MQLMMSAPAPHSITPSGFLTIKSLAWLLAILLMAVSALLLWMVVLALSRAHAVMVISSSMDLSRALYFIIQMESVFCHLAELFSSPMAVIIGSGLSAYLQTACQQQLLVY